jgi:hypothetical protein
MKECKSETERLKTEKEEIILKKRYLSWETKTTYDFCFQENDVKDIHW